MAIAVPLSWFMSRRRGSAFFVRPRERMTISTFIPSWRGCLALAVGLVDGFLAPLVIPAYDGPGVSVPQFCLAIFLAVSTMLVCSFCFRKRHGADVVAAAFTAAFAAWIFYEVIVRVHRVVA